ncbi:MAG: hypothetical protein EZS28_001420 [Streblomastix strix]|uniref:Uncharacterized protein n=1 Tax=Streblomastix strix TaxID=222440 RepID=A0A5J4X878_9EUKA|nr:MAG: hypothetical protein EZS28_001420 [Streblomastix strix]
MNREMSNKANKVELDCPIKLSIRALIDVDWWITQIRNNKPRNIEIHKTQAMITTDASLKRQGVTLQIPGEETERVKTDNTVVCNRLIKGKAKE